MTLKDTLKIEELEIDTYIAEALFKLQELTNISTDDLEIQYGVLNGYYANKTNNRLQRKALVRLINAIEELENR